MSDIPSWSIIDDTSSFLFYSGYWQDQSVPYPDQQTPALDPYYNRTYHTTTGDQNYIKFSWLGSGISVYGTKRAKWVTSLGITGDQADDSGSHGIYSIILDADSGTASREYLDGYSSDEAINSTLYTKDLAYGTHEIYIISESYRTNIKDRNSKSFSTDRIDMS